MSLLRTSKAIKIATIVLAGIAANPAAAQKICKNQYPCGSCAVYDNNGSDLAGFTKNYKKQLVTTGTKVIQFSDDQWGYLLVRTAHVPSVSTNWETKGDLNHAAYIRTTLVMEKTKDDAVATWWARECNLDNGAMVQLRVKEGDSKVDMEQARYTKVTSGLIPKKFTLVEYLDTFNMRDYDNMLKSHIVTKCGTIAQDDYRGFIDFYNSFLGKFSYVDDPVITKMSFVTFFAGANTHYVGYFNVVNSKLSGTVEAIDVQYERDRDTLVKKTFRNLTGKTVYIYGDDSFGLDKTLIKYAKRNDLKLRRRKTSVTTKFNDER